MKRKIEDDFGYLDGDKKNRLFVILGSAVLLIVIVILCVLIWKMLHREETAGKEPVTNQTEESQLLEENGAQEDESSADSSSEESAGLSEEEAEQSVTEETPKETLEAETPKGNSGEQSQEDAEEDNIPVSGSEDGEKKLPDMSFDPVDETVTAKDVTNLRTQPSTASDDTVVTQLKNGVTARRTGINESTGWSRLEYEGEILYAVNRYLTTDLTPKSEPSKEPQKENTSGNDSGSNTVITKDGRSVTFTPCDDTVSPKIEVNLRSEPSTSQGNDTVHHVIPYGVNLHRTGIDEAAGWSRVEYEGKVYYAVTSYIYVIDKAQ